MDWFNITLYISMFLVVLILAWGLITMARGGEYNKSKSNTIMRYRIVFQAIAIIIFGLTNRTIISLMELF